MIAVKILAEQNLQLNKSIPLIFIFYFIVVSHKYCRNQLKVLETFCYVFTPAAFHSPS